jgi:hypothetical protein
MLQWIVIIYFLVINLVLFSMMGYDKKQAKRGDWRNTMQKLVFGFYDEISFVPLAHLDRHRQVLSSISNHLFPRH